ncbi:dihydrodipicolinate synthase family protein [Solirubrobacter taibaiensis]|nr:dihydrodipicolinate synthase family protein [Solirubrobacter taibaiensis]
MIEGVYVAAVTPFRDDFSIDLDAYRAHVEWLAERGVTGIVAFGTNGEGPSVAAHEKLEVLRALADSPVPVIPTVAEANLPDTLALLAALEDFDAPGVMVLPPYFFKPASAAGLLAFYEPVVAASRHPVVLYHIPRFSVPIPPEVVGALPVWGVKDSGEEAEYTPAIVAAGREVLVGTEDDLATRLGRGGSGVVSGLANAAPELVVSIYEAVRSGDAEAAAERSARLRTIRDAATGFAARKRLASLRSGNDLGTVRPPLTPVTDDGALRELADQIEGVRA